MGASSSSPETGLPSMSRHAPAGSGTRSVAAEAGLTTISPLSSRRAQPSPSTQSARRKFLLSDFATIHAMHRHFYTALHSCGYNDLCHALGTSYSHVFDHNSNHLDTERLWAGWGARCRAVGQDDGAIVWRCTGGMFSGDTRPADRAVSGPDSVGKVKDTLAMVVQNAFYLKTLEICPDAARFAPFKSKKNSKVSQTSE